MPTMRKAGQAATMWRSRCTQRNSIPVRCKHLARMLQLIMRISSMAETKV